MAASVDDGLARIEQALSVASKQGAVIVCFPEAYLPGLRGQDFEVIPFDQTILERAPPGRERPGADTRHRHHPRNRMLFARGPAHRRPCLRCAGQVLGCQTKNQIDPTEDPFYIPGSGRRIFEVAGLRFGIAICHEGFRYPETVRWAAVRGAKVVFHPHCTGGNQSGEPRAGGARPMGLTTNRR